jgi:hypothetical protein
MLLSDYGPAAGSKNMIISEKEKNYKKGSGLFSDRDFVFIGLSGCSGIRFSIFCV